ncbi:hypothetical protein AHAS_Ahas12G0111600 [Arachis hypogaea]
MRSRLEEPPSSSSSSQIVSVCAVLAVVHPRLVVTEPLSSYLDILMAAADVEFRCFVGGLAWATDNEVLEKALSAYGEIVESKVRLLQALSIGI